jgi:hypothetical protein
MERGHTFLSWDLADTRDFTPHRPFRSWNSSFWRVLIGLIALIRALLSRLGTQIDIVDHILLPSFIKGCRIRAGHSTAIAYPALVSYDEIVEYAGMVEVQWSEKYTEKVFFYLKVGMLRCYRCIVACSMTRMLFDLQHCAAHSFRILYFWSMCSIALSQSQDGNGDRV